MSVMPEFKRKALWHTERPILKPSHAILRECARLYDLQFPGPVIRLREMTSITVVFGRLLRLPVTAKAGSMGTGPAFSGDRLEGIRLNSLERLIRLNPFQWQ